MSVSYGGDKITFDDGTSIASGLSHFRNRIINGDMRIDQRNNGAAINTDNAALYAVDRFFFLEDAATTGTTQQVSDAPAGFSNSFRFTNSATTATPTYAQFVQRIEGYNVADLNFGTASAKTVTLSFWVKSSLIGQFSVSLRNSASNRSNVSTYTINAANTWEYKTITFVGDTTGTWLTTSGNGLELIYRIAGSGGTSTLNQWAATGDAFASGTVNVMGTANATWQITGVQLEAGSYATTFERRPFGTELQLCQRYLPAYRHNGQDILPSQIQFNASTTSRGFISFPVPTRVPVTGMTISSASHFTIFGFAGGNGTASGFTMHAGGTMAAGIDVSTGTSFTTRDCGTLGITNSSGFVYFTGAELA